MVLPLKYFFSIVVFVLFACSTLLGQQSRLEVSREISFVNHMISRQNTQEALFLLQNISPADLYQKDTVNYLTGWLLYGQKDLEASAHYLSQVSKNSPFYHKSVFFTAYNYAYLRNIASSLHFLEAVSADTTQTIRQMVNFQRAGIALLERRVEDFDTYALGFRGTMNVLAQEEKKFIDYRSRILDAPSRSPVMAGIMSAAVPGLGKVYAGKTAEGISSFLYVGAMMASSWDFYSRFGNRHPLFWISAGLSGIFYIGNIYGSAVAVNRVQNEFNYEMDQRILLDMHIPLRKLFP